MKRLKVNRSVYSDFAIEQTILAYRDYAVITINYQNDYAIITFWKCKYNEEQTFKEFENYMIGVENS